MRMPPWPRAAAARRLPAMALLALAGCGRSPPPAASPPVPSAPAPQADCAAPQLALTLDSRDGWFDGMSHSGTMLVLRNVGQAACRIPAWLIPRLQDASGRPLALSDPAPPDDVRRDPPPSVELPPGASAESAMRWVSGDVYDHGRCLSPAFVTLAIGTGQVSAAFAGHLCGPGDKPPAYTLTPFKAAASSPR